MCNDFSGEPQVSRKMSHAFQQLLKYNPSSSGNFPEAKEER